jgi:hypothetical protein
MDFVALQKGKEIGKVRIFSIGGGAIRIKGETAKGNLPVDLYKEQYTVQILNTCRTQKLNLFEFIKKHEDASF